MRINFQFRNWNDLLIVDDTTAVGTNPSRPATAADLVNGAPSSALEMLPSGLTTQLYRMMNVNAWHVLPVICSSNKFNLLLVQLSTPPRLQLPTFVSRMPSKFFSSLLEIQLLPRNGRTTPPLLPSLAPHRSTSPPQVPSIPSIPPRSSTKTQTVLHKWVRTTSRLSTPTTMPLSFPSKQVTTCTRTRLTSCASTPWVPPTTVNSPTFLFLPAASQGAIDAANGNGQEGADHDQTFELVVTAVNNNIIRVSGGALGFPSSKLFQFKFILLFKK